MNRTFIKLNEEEVQRTRKTIETQRTVLARSLDKEPKVVEYSNINSMDEYLIKRKEW